MKLLSLFIMVTCSFTPALADEVKYTFPFNPVLVESHREKRAHWYTPHRGQNLFTYELGAAPAFTSKKKLKGCIDRRPFAQQHPIKHKANRVRSGCIYIAPYAGVAAAGFSSYGSLRSTPRSGF